MSGHLDTHDSQRNVRLHLLLVEKLLLLHDCLPCCHCVNGCQDSYPCL